MRIPRPFAIVLTLLGVLGASAASAQKGDKVAEAPRRLDPDVVSIRLQLGVGDQAKRPWSGRASLDRGEVVGVEGGRFRQGDRVNGRDSWVVQSHTIRKVAAKKKANAAPAKAGGPGTTGASITPNLVIVSLKAPADATLTVETEQGRFAIPLAEVADGRAHPYLNGQVEAQRIANGVPLRDGPEQADFPSAAADTQGSTWVAYVEHQPRGPEDLESFQDRPKSFAEFAPSGGGDQVRLIRFADGQGAEPLDVTAPGLDVWRPSAAIDRDGKVVVIWSENKDGNWDLYRRAFDPEKSTWSDVARLTTNAGTDVDAVLASTPDLGVWVAWQSWDKGASDIWLARVDPAGTLGEPIRVSASPGNEWSPAIAIRGNRAYVAYDSYQDGNYDVHLFEAGLAGDDLSRKTTAIANSPKYEARPSVAADGRGRVWVAYEERDANWGKDAENLLQGQGSTLYRSAAVKVRCVVAGRVVEVPNPVADAPAPLRLLNSYPRLALDRDGRLWLAFRHRQEAIWGGNAVMVVGGVWVEYATSLSGRAWDPPQPLPRSDGLLDNRPALVAPSSGPVLAFYSTDGRLRREVEPNPELNRRFGAQSATPGGPGGVFNLDLEVATLTPVAKPGGAEPTAEPGEAVPAPEGAAPSVHPEEPADVARMRGYRIETNGKTYRLLRGDFHRHTELSMDGGSDGSFEDMWRYAIDAARLDWMGFGDHDNGAGKEYTWWLSQKTTDLYNSPSLVSMFTYERSVAYPHGHRNVMFSKRGIRTLPRLVGAGGVVDEDTLMLYDYLKEHGGLCASHTSGTGMGTDWRDVNAELEPLVEIFQGHRNSYEHLGAPRVARRPGEAIGGWKPLGMVWNALAMQYRLGFQASSDHISTHISYAIAIAEDGTREAVFDAFKRRHCYGATDNIVLDVRSGPHIMGDEFRADGPVRLKVFVHGTRPIARVDIIKDFVYVYSTEPGRQRVEFEWKDDEKRPPGLSWYYVRAIQDDGEIAWGSPFWVRFPAGTAED